MPRMIWSLAAIAIAFVSACGGRTSGVEAADGGGKSGQGGSAAGSGGFFGNGGVKGTGGRKIGTGGFFPGTGGTILPGTGGFFDTGGFPGTGGLVGSCDPVFCMNTTQGKGCCLTPNGPCGVDYGMGCTPPAPPGQCRYDTDCPQPPVPCMPCPDGTCVSPQTHCQGGTCVTSMNSCPATVPVCYPGYCPPTGNGKGCCLSDIGPCGADYGMGCVPLCSGSGCLQTNPGYTWHKGCVSTICRDAGPTLPVCNVASKEVADAPCASPGSLCTVTYGCTDVLICATPESCPIPL